LLVIEKSIVRRELVERKSGLFKYPEKMRGSFHLPHKRPPLEMTISEWALEGVKGGIGGNRHGDCIRG
jgi:hypothetical protein